MAVNAMQWMVQQATIKRPTDVSLIATHEQAELIRDIARRMGGVTFTGLMLELDLSRPTVSRYTSAAVAAGLVTVERRGPRQIRWIEAT